MSNAYDFSFTSIDGGPLPLEQFKGKPVLVVNVASRCGLTPQYEGMEALYRDYRDQGLVVLGVPCNQFAGQEPGTEAEIKDFCQTKFDVDFPLTGKVDVKDEGRHPFYAWAEDKLGTPAVPVWNFHKILIGKDGEALAAFGPRTPPQDAEIVGAVEKAL
jgi:glutathione peroxidase